MAYTRRPLWQWGFQKSNHTGPIQETYCGEIKDILKELLSTFECVESFCGKTQKTLFSFELFDRGGCRSLKPTNPTQHIHNDGIKDFSKQSFNQL